LRWEVIFVDIGGIVDHHSMSWSERWFLLILVELLTITQWVEVTDDFCWYWWNYWPSLNELRWEVIFVDIGGIVDHHSMRWIEGWFFLYWWWNYWPSLNDLKWEVMFVDVCGIVEHHSMSWGERWFLLILVELLTIAQWFEVRCDFGWYWWNCWPSLNEFRWEVIFVDIGRIVDHHSMSWSEKWFLLILVELLTSLNELMWGVIFVNIGGIVYHHSMS
jgi:hypothetical protein